MTKLSEKDNSKKRLLQSLVIDSKSRVKVDTDFSRFPQLRLTVTNIYISHGIQIADSHLARLLR